MRVEHVGLFRIVEPEDADYEGCLDVWNSGDFPWEYAVRDNVKDTGMPFIPIGFEDKPESWGFYQRHTNKVNLDRVSTYGAVNFRWVLTHELSHLIDDVMLTNEARFEIHRLMHDGSPVKYEDCHAMYKRGTYAEWRWGSKHSDKASEAYANLLPKVWCPPHSRSMENYGPHYFTRKQEIMEITMAGAQDPFSDVPEDGIHREAILWAVRNGIVVGNPDGTFEPSEGVTRGQMCTFLYNYDRSKQ